MTAEVLQGDCLEVMRGLADASVDAIVCDPPYALTANKKGGSGAASVNLDSPYGRARIGTGNGAGGFMGMAWDASLPTVEVWAEALRVAKPGAHLVAFGGSRTYHRLACAIEDAGWEIRDTLMWLYGSGFPKSLDVSKALDKVAGAERESTGRVLSVTGNRAAPSSALVTSGLGAVGVGPQAHMETLPATDAAKQWAGWGTALKPAHEPIVLARKPLAGTVAATVAQYGTGALNIDGCRIEGGERPHIERRNDKSLDGDVYGSGINGSRSLGTFTAGRWPANVVLGCACAGAAHDPACAVALLDAQSGERGNHGGAGHYASRSAFGGGLVTPAPQDTGGASRFYYCAKASRREREAGLEGLPEGAKRILNGGIPSAVNSDPRGMSGGGERTARNTHPTVKPVALMRWLCRLVTPAGGRILDPFCGSGSTGCAAVAEGFRFVGIEREAEYVEIARRRIAAAQTQPQLAA